MFTVQLSFIVNSFHGLFCLSVLHAGNGGFACVTGRRFDSHSPVDFLLVEEQEVGIVIKLLCCAVVIVCYYYYYLLYYGVLLATFCDMC